MANYSDKSVRNSAFRLSTKNAWAKYVRNRWPTNTLGEIQRAWNITEGQARGVIYAQISQSTIDDILDSLPPLKAYALSLEILCIRLNVELEEYIRHQAEEARNERAKWQAREHHLEALAARVAEPRSIARFPDQQAGPSGTGHAGLGGDAETAPVRLTTQTLSGDAS